MDAVKAMKEGGLDGGDNTSALEGVVDYYPYHGTGGFGGLSIPPSRRYRAASTRNNRRNDNGDDGLDYDNDGYNHSNSHNSGDDLDHDRGSANDNNYSNSEPLYRAPVVSMSPDYPGEDMEISDSDNGGYTP
ncbi:hypothetical protein K440DRAFT_641377 [Wilcoxina mikolae CBS 423.85]|nr:hypothetical protein K440DRAFT_641377 [Wilcoxina mikolae CBS 423.85]